MTLRSFVLGAVLLVSPALAAPQEPAPAEAPALATDVFWHEAPTLVPVQMVFPPGFDAAAPRTLVVALHGFGDTSSRFRPVADVLATAGHVVALPEATYAFPAGGRIGFDWTLHHLGDAAASSRAIRLLGTQYLPGLVEAIRARATVDRVILLGFSQGAAVALLTGLHDPATFDAVISLGLPMYNPEWFGEGALEAARDVGVLLVHGTHDEIAPIDATTRARDHLAGAGLAVTFRAFDGGHTVAPDELVAAVRWIAGPLPDGTDEGDPADPGDAGP